MPADLRRLLTRACVRWELALGSLLMFISAGGLVASPWLLGKAVNELRHGSTGSLIAISLAIAGAGLLAGATSAAATWLLGRCAITAGVRIRDLVFDRLLSAPFTLYRTHATGQLVARATADVEPIKLLITTGVSVATQLVGTVAFAVVIMLLIDPVLAAIALGPLPVAVLVQLRYSSSIRVATADAEQRRGEMAAEAAESIRGMRLIASLGREAERRERFDHAVGGLFRAWLRVGRLDAIYGGLLVAIPYIGLALVLAFGGRAVIHGRISLGEFVTFYAFLAMLAAASAQVGYLTYVTASAAGSATRIVELIDHPMETIGDGLGRERIRHPPDLRLRDVSLSEATTAPLRGASIDARRGETVALVGATGAGMRTVLELVNGLISPEEGTIELDGGSVGEAERSRLRRISAPAASGYLFAMSIAENIAYGRSDASRAEIEAAARLADAHEFILAFPEGYETQVGEEGGQLSGGERQRIALARALLASRPVLLLDDVMSALDPRAANRVVDGLSSVSGSATRLLSTHAARALRLADRIVVMEAGRVVGAGTHRELLERCRPYRTMVELWEAM